MEIRKLCSTLLSLSIYRINSHMPTIANNIIHEANNQNEVNAHKRTAEAEKRNISIILHVICILIDC